MYYSQSGGNEIAGVAENLQILYEVIFVSNILAILIFYCISVQVKEKKYIYAQINHVTKLKDVTSISAGINGICEKAINLADEKVFYKKRKLPSPVNSYCKYCGCLI